MRDHLDLSTIHATRLVNIREMPPHIVAALGEIRLEAPIRLLAVHVQDVHHEPHAGPHVGELVIVDGADVPRVELERAIAVSRHAGGGPECVDGLAGGKDEGPFAELVVADGEGLVVDGECGDVAGVVCVSDIKTDEFCYVLVEVDCEIGGCIVEALDGVSTSGPFPNFVAKKPPENIPSSSS